MGVVEILRKGWLAIGFFVAAFLAATFLFATASMANTPATNFNELLQIIEREAIAESQLHRQREAEFVREKNQQRKLLQAAEAEKQNLEKRSKALSATFDENRELIATKQLQLQQELGEIKELFGHLTATAGDLRSQTNQSMVSVQYPDRAQFFDQLIAKMNSQTQIPSIADIDRLWFELQREVIETGRVVKLTAPVTDAAGATSDRDVVRVGVFNVVSDGQFLHFDADSQQLSVLPRQPAGTRQILTDVATATSDPVKMLIDPTGPVGSSFLNALIATPSLLERWHQGGLIGYFITALGAIGLLLALWRYGSLSTITRKVSQQQRAKELKPNNPLGRVLAIAHENPTLDNESLELKMEEGILREKPGIEKGLNWLRIIYMVAPLLGLLGTVTGMIQTFQVITIFGAGDPQAMAGGISSALVTTVLGLLVAIPVVLLHTLVSAQAKKIVAVLEQQATGMIAEARETKG